MDRNSKGRVFKSHVNWDDIPILTDDAFECVSYSENCRKKLTSGECERKTKKCPQPATNHDMKQACITVWSNDTVHGVKVHLQDCTWSQDKPPHLRTDCRENECVEVKPKNVVGNHTTYVCCCLSSNCNREFRYEPAPSVATPKTTAGNRTVAHPNDGNELASTLIFAFLPIFLIALFVAFSYWVYRRYRLRRMIEKEGGGLKHLISRSSLPLKPIQLLEEITRGRYGKVWKGRLHDRETVAVKIFPASDVDSWMQEQNIYATPGLKEHPNILTFLGAEARENEIGMEYWLITNFHERGSMYDFLKRNTVTLPDSLRLATSMLRGLAFLHEEHPGNEDTHKPTIVHRDFKSKNVLVKSDMTACIADFGLAVRCEHGRPPSDVHAQVGTRRYMAPEVLQGATEFSAFAFRQIDVYACALVLWELFSRTSLDGEPVDEFRLPFEQEVGLRPTVDALQDLVATQKKRPVFKNLWHKNPRGILICATIEEMWDMEAEARVSAGCALERLLAVSTTAATSSQSSSGDSGIASDITPLISDYNSNMTTISTVQPSEPQLVVPVIETV